jgi:hypothetical protein
LIRLRINTFLSFFVNKYLFKVLFIWSYHNPTEQEQFVRHIISTKTRQAEMTTVVSFETVDGDTSGTASVPTGGSPEEDASALMTHLQSTFGWRPDDIVLEMYEPGKYVILFDTASTRFIREECSVAEATTEADKETVQKEFHEYIIRDHIRELDLNEIYSHYNITPIGECAFQGCTSLTTIAIPDSVTAICKFAFYSCISLTTIDMPFFPVHLFIELFMNDRFC